MLAKYRVFIEPIQFDDLHTVIVVDYPPLLRAVAPLPSETARNRAGLPRVVKVPFDSTNLVQAVVRAQWAERDRLPTWDTNNRLATKARLVLPLPVLAPDQESELLAVYAPALVEISARGRSFGGDLLAILGVDPRQQVLLDSLTRPGLEAFHLRSLLEAGTKWDASLRGDLLRDLNDPLPYLEGLRPFFEQGDGDITSDHGYPRLRNFHKLYQRNKEGLAALGTLPKWRAAFDEFERRHGYSACSLDWAPSKLSILVKFLTGRGGAASSSKPWPIATRRGKKAYIQSLPVSFRC